MISPLGDSLPRNRVRGHQSQREARQGEINPEASWSSRHPDGFVHQDPSVHGEPRAPRSPDMAVAPVPAKPRALPRQITHQNVLRLHHTRLYEDLIG